MISSSSLTLGHQTVYPLFGEAFRSVPHIIDFSNNNRYLNHIDVRDQHMIEEYIAEELTQSGKTWGIAGYLEMRERFLGGLSQMISEERFYHLGVDIIVPAGTVLYAPLDGEVVSSGYESGEGNYGGYVLLKHQIGSNIFYSFYGHQDPESVVPAGSSLRAGTPFSKVGTLGHNGQWFEHVHLQVLTQKAYELGFMSKGYCTTEQVLTMDELCPNPLFLLRYT